MFLKDTITLRNFAKNTVWYENNTTIADLPELHRSIRNMLQYIKTGVACDAATKVIDEEITETETANRAGITD